MKTGKSFAILAIILLSQNAFATIGSKCSDPLTYNTVTTCMIVDHTHNATEAKIKNGTGKTTKITIAVYGRVGGAPSFDNLIYQETKTLSNGATTYTKWYGGTVGKTYKACAHFGSYMECSGIIKLN